ncbi:MAG: hypothetical protein R6U32_01225 [Candidatus Woesearchaeota archaeon]
MTKLLIDLSGVLDEQVCELSQRRGVSKAGLARWAISRLVEAESNGTAEMD